MFQSENWNFCDLISPIEITPPKNWHITSKMLVGRLFSFWNAPYFQVTCWFWGCTYEVSKSSLGQPVTTKTESWRCAAKKKAGIKAAVSWLNVYLRCLACQNSVVCCLKNEASKKKWRRKWRVKLMHLCIQSIAVLGVDGLQPRNMVGVSWKKSNNPASLISNCLFWAYPGRLWKVSFHMLKNVCSCSFGLDASYFANSWNTECTQGLVGVFFLWHFSAILIWMESCRSAIVERRDTRMKPAAKTLKFTCPPATQSCHPLTPICHLNPPGVLHTLLENKVTKVGWPESFTSGKSFGCHFFWWCVCWFCMPPLAKSYAEYRYFPIPDSWQNQGGLSSNISQGSTANGGVVDISIYGRDFNKLHLSYPL